jgi:hypothetical protein
MIAPAVDGCKRRLEGGHHELRSFLFTSHMKQARLL